MQIRGEKRSEIQWTTVEEAGYFLAANKSLPPPVFRCIVTGLVQTLDTEDLVKAFSPFGDVIDSKVLKERHTGKSKEFGFVTFSSEALALAAIEAMNGQDLQGRIITVFEAQST
ncbi:hypothetical protein RIF29_17693 [Crotalaria pallida]|uniref:RRM domain-containing protein n=1 Tax=Crotalaria pallida TaxID=3830 RepID=A0AAN9IKH5_CROPI